MKRRTQQNKTHPLEPKPDHSNPHTDHQRTKIGPQEPKADHWRNKCTPRQNPSRPQLNQKQINVTHNVVQGVDPREMVFLLLLISLRGQFYQSMGGEIWQTVFQGFEDWLRCVCVCGGGEKVQKRWERKVVKRRYKCTSWTWKIIRTKY